MRDLRLGKALHLARDFSLQLTDPTKVPTVRRHPSGDPHSPATTTLAKTVERREFPLDGGMAILARLHVETRAAKRFAPEANLIHRQVQYENQAPNADHSHEQYSASHTPRRVGSAISGIHEPVDRTLRALAQE